MPGRDGRLTRGERRGGHTQREQWGSGSRSPHWMTHQAGGFEAIAQLVSNATTAGNSVILFIQ